VEISGNLRKMTSRLDSVVNYFWRIQDDEQAMNPLIGQSIQLHFNGEINCMECGRKTKKSYSQGYCFPCTQKLAACDICIVRPEKCHFDEGTCREPEWAQGHCFQPHIVYLANTSGVKVGITRQTQIPTRWIDQGATQALPIFQGQNRKFVGLVEHILKDQVADKTDWRRMLKGNADDIDLFSVRDQILGDSKTELLQFFASHGSDAIVPVTDVEILKLQFPVKQFPEKVKPLNLDKTPTIEGVLQGIKGQYLILDCGVLNIRKYAGYQVSLRA